MRPGGGHAKGAQFEREVCERLSRWIDAKSDETLFWRSAMSGGRATIRGRKGKKDSQAGDIACVGAAGMGFSKIFAIECKRVADLNLRAALIHGKGALFEYWHQTALAAILAEKLPLLIAQQDRQPALVFLQHSSAAQYFGAVSQIELARLFRLDSNRVSMYLLDDLMRMPYVKSRFTK